jgi:shikimate dehydrogenase
MIHQIFARETHQSMTYELIEASAEEFETAVRGFAAAGGKGMNVTVPHKEAAFALCRTAGPEAEAAGAVNTITFSGKTIVGDNTDGIGFMRDLTVNKGLEPTGRTVLVLGAGGAARGILVPLLAASPARLMIANRNQSRAEALRDALGAGDAIEIRSFDELESAGTFDLVVNATSAGLKNETMPFPTTIVGPETFCYDLVYGRKSTPFAEWASAAGAGGAVHGWGMLVEQAAESFRIWRGVRPDTAQLVNQR